MMAQLGFVRGAGVVWALLGSVVFTAACGGGAQQAGAATADSPQQTNVGADDASRCDFKGRADREVIESSGPGAIQPNVRRVFGILGEGEDRRRVLFCREIDTNLDSTKDVVRTYNDKGDAVEEQADSNYDGRVDTWLRFASGRISKVELDRNRDGKPDETRYYVKGKISRIQRDSNYDGRSDVWEVYGDGQLERMGVDLDYDGHVDRWDRDEVSHRIAEERAREEEEKAEAAKKAEEAPAKAEDAPAKPEAAMPGAAKPEAAKGTAAAAAAGEKPTDKAAPATAEDSKQTP